ncbi:MAG: Fur family transcriptional regulator [Candidatus Odinarchaeota archaeon]
MENKMKRSGLRITPQRLEIARILENLKNTHPSFTDICNAVNKKYPNMSRSTVHNNLKALEKLGLIASFSHIGETRYEMNLYLHINVVEKDGSIQDINDEEIRRHLEEILKIIRKKGKQVKNLTVIAD